MDDYIVRMEVDKWLEWRAALKRLTSLGYQWVSGYDKEDKWHDSYYWNEGSRVIYIDTRSKKLTRGSKVDPFKIGRLIGLKDIKK